MDLQERCVECSCWHVFFRFENGISCGLAFGLFPTLSFSNFQTPKLTLLPLRAHCKESCTFCGRMQVLWSHSHRVPSHHQFPPIFHEFPQMFHKVQWICHGFAMGSPINSWISRSPRVHRGQWGQSAPDLPDLPASAAGFCKHSQYVYRWGIYQVYLYMYVHT